MENAARDSTDEWRLSERARPPTVAELEARIDEAIAIARASEEAAISIGAAAIESAEQARRAADLAVQASETASRGVYAHASRNGHDEERLARFRRRADRVGARFAQLQRR